MARAAPSGYLGRCDLGVREHTSWTEEKVRVVSVEVCYVSLPSLGAILANQEM